MTRVYVAVVTVWCAVAWIPFPAGFVLVRLLDPRQGDRMAFATGVGIATLASAPTLLLWLGALLVVAARSRQLPSLLVTLGLLLVAGLAGAVVSAAVGSALDPWGALLGAPAIGAVVLLLLATAIAHPLVRALAGLPRDPDSVKPS